jgi:cytochrome c oxidase cbb3-type subunit I
MSTESPSSAEQDAILRTAIDRSMRHPVMFFFTSGAVWLALSLILGILAVAKMISPELLDGWAVFTQGRVFAAHISTLVYGWGCQAAFGVLIWLVARLTRQENRASGIVLAAGHAWNLIVSVGTIAILLGYGTGVPWMEFPAMTWPALLMAYALIAIWTMIQFRVRAAGEVFVAQWFAVGALIWLPWILATAYALIFVIGGNALMSAAVAAWFRSGMTYLFFLPTAAAVAYYLAPKITGRPVHSYSTSLIGFWALAIIGPWAGMQKLAGAPIPYFLPYLGAAAAVLIGVPTAAIAISTLRTMLSCPEKFAASPALRFSAAGVICMLLLGVFGVLINLPDSTLPLTQFSITTYGMDILAIYGCFTFLMFGAIYFIVPRVTRREWLSKRFIKLHFLFSMYAVITVATLAVLGGLLHGQGQEDFKFPWENAVARAYPYLIGTLLAWCFVLISNLFFCLHLLLMWMRLGRRSSHPTLLGHAHLTSPHGPEGDIDNAGPGSVIAH